MEFFALLVLCGGMYGLTYTPVAAFLAGALMFGTIWFWCLIALVCVLLFAFIDHDNGAGATVTLIVFAFVQQLFGDFKVFNYVKENPLHTAKWVALYFVAGTLWSIAKWWFYVRTQREDYDEKKRRYLDRNDVDGDVIPSSLKRGWADFAPEKPSAANNKEKILRWMSFWPWSALWTLINDPIKKLFKAIYKRLQNLYQRIVDHVWKGTEADFK